MAVDIPARTPCPEAPRSLRRVAWALMKLLPLLLAVLLSLPVAAQAGEDAVAEGLKKKAQEAFLAGRYQEAVAHNLKIAREHPDAEARRYAVQMLGTIHENNLISVAEALKWHREFLERYADPQQAAFYKEKTASLEKMLRQEKAFAEYQEIRFANQGDRAMVERFEELLAKHPDFLLRAEVQRELGYAYARLDQRRESYRAFGNLSASGGGRFSADDRVAYQKAGRHWQATALWGGIAWSTVALLWLLALSMKPWRRMTRASMLSFAVTALVWLAVSAARIPSFHAINSSGDEFLFPEAAVYLAAAVNLPVLFWLQLFARGEFWRARPRALRWSAPLLALPMTASVCYLFLIHQPNGAKIMDAFGAKYRHWAQEWVTPEGKRPTAGAQTPRRQVENKNGRPPGRQAP